ncbi:MAG: 6-pyruvoyl-tetrahydropterin synthase-related protein [Anaerolineae bacterium]|nr:6-pyruvoyl-tetrahydropterin synthase-related protein [Anaerolineae bacterium]
MKVWLKRVWKFPGPFLLLILTLPALLPLFKPGLWASHDPFHHLFRAFDLDYALRGGELYPRWLPNLGFFYGYPVTNFYAPLSYYLVVFFHWLGLGFINSLKATFGLSFLLAAFTAYRWAEDLFGEEAGLWVAAVYTYFTYHIANAYIRAALAEHLAFVFFPIVLLLIQKIARKSTLKLVPFLALGIAGLILTHNLSAFIFAPFVFIYSLVAVLAQPYRRIKAFVLLAASATLGFTLSAFYWLPALTETKWIRAGQVAPSVTEPLEFLLPVFELISRSLIHKYPLSRHLLSPWQIFLIVCGLTIALVGFRTFAKEKKILLMTAVFSVAIAVFMSTTASSFLWLHFKPLTFLQFPWRFQTMVGLFGAILVAPLASFLSLRAPKPVRLVIFSFVLAFLAFTSLAGIKWEPLTWPETGKPVLREKEVDFHSMAQYDYQTALWARLWGGPWLLEYLPVTVKVPREEFWLPREGPSPWPESYHWPEEIKLESVCPLKFTLTIKSSQETYIRWHQFWFPGWRATANGRPIPVTPSPELGLITVTIPAGEHKVKIWFGDTLPRTIGKAISLAGVLLLLLLLWRGGLRRQLFGLALLVILWFALWGWQNFRQSTCVSPKPTKVIFEEKIALLGINFRLEKEKAEATLYWMALKPIEENLTAFVHVLDREGQKISQHDGPPGESFSPTTRWEPGEIIPDRHLIHLPPQSTPMRIRVGLYRFKPDLKNLAMYNLNSAESGEALEIAIRDRN